jgi:hypothetical protein
LEEVQSQQRPVKDSDDQSLSHSEPNSTVADLEVEIERLKETLVRQENENYETVAILKEENRKL